MGKTKFFPRIEIRNIPVDGAVVFGQHYPDKIIINSGIGILHLFLTFFHESFHHILDLFKIPFHDLYDLFYLYLTNIFVGSYVHIKDKTFYRPSTYFSRR